MARAISLSSAPHSGQLARAAKLIREGKLVAFPTETVYGLGANALDPEAVARIFEVKSRPPTSPLIVHVDSIEMARSLASGWPATADALAARFWPGPLTLILPKHWQVPDIVTAGLQTVGLRVPAHPVALALIRQAKTPIAAPSANRFSKLSPTTAQHVRDSIGNGVDLILDAGPTEIGIESTVLSLAGEEPVLLRPGMISDAEIEAVIGPVQIRTANTEGPHPSPGLHPKHYSPATPLVLVDGPAELPNSGRGAYLWRTKPGGRGKSVRMPFEARGYAAVLYDTLHQMDREGLDWIAVEKLPQIAEWIALGDRLARAASASGTLEVPPPSR